jgi:predicted SAM-dependent methyltransferase
MIRQSIKDLYFGLVRYLSIPNTALARIKYRLSGPTRPEGHYLHLGCGFKYLPGMINADGNAFRKIDLWLDLRNGLPFPDQSCAFVYSSHTIEHLFPYEAITLLKEIHRVLKPDGVARIAVPSMEHALVVAMGGGKEEDWPRPFGDPVSQAVNYLFCDGQHKYAYTYDILRRFAEEAGFGTVTHASALWGVEPRAYGAVTVGDEPEGSLVVELGRSK